MYDSILSEMCRTDKSIETESGLMVARALGRAEVGEQGVSANGYRFTCGIQIWN